MEKRRTALLITYYWPPSGGAGVHRWLRMSRFFRENGWDLHVYCPENAAWPTIDEALQEQVAEELTIIRRPIFEPHKYLGKKNNPNKGAGLTHQGKLSLLQRLIIWIRGNLFIPDARVFWIRPSVSYLDGYLSEHPDIEAIISTGPPHSMHIIARKLKIRNPSLKWVADFRDPWTQIDFYHELLPGKWADRRHKRLESAVLREADKVVTVSDSCATGLKELSGRDVEVITNGFIFPEFDPQKIMLDHPFTIAHFGSMPFARNPQNLWDALEELIQKEPEFAKQLEIKLVGSVDFKVFEAIDKAGLSRFVNHVQTVPHADSLVMQRQSQLLLLVANNTGNVKGILTGKFFEYLGARRPILAIGEAESDLENEMNFTGSGCFVDYTDVQKIKAYVLNGYRLYANGGWYHQAVGTERYSSASLTKRFLELLDKTQF